MGTAGLRPDTGDQTYMGNQQTQRGLGFGFHFFFAT